MTRLLVISDSHGETGLLERVLRDAAGAFDRIVHLGDGHRDVQSVAAADVPILQVSGNMDFSPLPFVELPVPELVTEIDGVRVLVTHGHRYRVHVSREQLRKRAREVSARLVLFGHTHTPENSGEDGILYFNPGALKHGSYGTVTLDNGAVCEARLRIIRTA